MKISHAQKHQAGRHLAVAHGLLHGYPSTLVGPQTFVQINGISTQVLVAGMGAWMIADVDKFTASTVKVFLLVNVTGSTPEICVVPGEELRADVRARYEEFMVRVGTRPRNSESRHTKILPSEVAKWSGHWSLFDEEPVTQA